LVNYITQTGAPSGLRADGAIAEYPEGTTPANASSETKRGRGLLVDFKVGLWRFLLGLGFWCQAIYGSGSASGHGQHHFWRRAFCHHFSMSRAGRLMRPTWPGTGRWR